MDDVRARALGASGLWAGALGLGCGALGAMPEAEGHALLSAALDLGVTLWDAARSYGNAEAVIGRHPRRREALLSTKLGYGVPGVPDWTYDSVALGVDGALARLGVERIDLVHLHSCPREVLERGEVVLALGRAVEAGKVRVAAYSGEEGALAWAVASGAFGAVQCSVNPCDQAALAGPVPAAAARGLAVLAKRPLANAAWETGPAGDPPVVEYRRRFALLGLPDPGMPWDEAFLRFSAWAPGVSAALVGTRRIDRLAAHAEAVARGPLPHDLERAFREQFRSRGAGWGGII